jgi:hypothetical protein
MIISPQAGACLSALGIVTKKQVYAPYFNKVPMAFIT